MTEQVLALGIDFGTSGARAVVIDHTGEIRAESSGAFGTQSPHDRATLWQTMLMDLLADLPLAIRQQLRAIAINGTSSTVLLCDRHGHPVAEPRLYNEGVRAEIVEELKAIAPANHPVLSTTSSLAKLYAWLEQVNEEYIDHPLTDDQPSNRQENNALVLRRMGKTNVCPSKPFPDGHLASFAHPTNGDSLGDSLYFLHQADWLAFLLHGQLGISDYHNSLKLGYDVGALAYPAWFKSIWFKCGVRGDRTRKAVDSQMVGSTYPTEGFKVKLPRVVAPGQVIGGVTEAIARQFGLNPACQVCAGTTDSIAAFLASGVQHPGEAVTSLGSTLVLKLLSTTRVDDARYGIYSHRLGDQWLVGGASNTGGAVLRSFFSDDELEELSDRIPWQQTSGLSYYPLLKPGERFPINDPKLQPCFTPRPEDPVAFLHGLLESMARIEAQGYEQLVQLGATPLNQLYTAGGGAKNQIWTQIRHRYLGIPVYSSTQTEAAYGSARLALSGLL